MYPVIQQDKTSNAKEIHILSVNTLDSLISINIKRKDIVSKWTILKDNLTILPITIQQQMTLYFYRD